MSEISEDVLTELYMRAQSQRRSEWVENARAIIAASAEQADRYRSYFGDKHPGDVHQELLSAYAEIERLKVAAPTPAAAQDGPKCRACNGNDGDMPCAYPEGHPHCLRNIAAKGSGGHD
jgi:hypothetical protein